MEKKESKTSKDVTDTLPEFDAFCKREDIPVERMPIFWKTWAEGYAAALKINLKRKSK